MTNEITATPAKSSRGGARAGAGRKKMAKHERVLHRPREEEAGGYPMHITIRAVRGLPSFRQARIAVLVLLQLRRLNDAAFQLVHFSIQSNHVHLIVEADHRGVVRRKLTGLMVSFAKRINAKLGRVGKVWRDRYFCRDITSASDMHRVLKYVFGNAKKHGEIPRDALQLDSFSSAWTFDGWDMPIELPPESLRWTPPMPRTELLRRDWIAHGLLRVGDAPRV